MQPNFVRIGVYLPFERWEKRPEYLPMMDISNRFLFLKKWLTLIFGALILVFSKNESWSQVPSAISLFVRVDTILIEGNRKTRPALILRELEFAAGDSLSLANLAETLERNRLRVMNTGLFSNSTIALEPLEPGDRLAVRLVLTEAWYLYPIPLFELADRNFNVWWTDFNRSLKRVNYGISWTHLNLSGLADVLKLNLNFGYTNRYEAVYERPWFNPRQTLGFRAAVGYSRNHEVQYRTLDNKQQFYVDQDAWMRQRLSANLTLNWRPKLFTNHAFALEYYRNEVGDTIATVANPDFFLNGRSRQRHLSLVYRLVVDYRDIRPYPTDGWIGTIEVRQNGLLPSDDLHLLRLTGELKKYFRFSPRWSLETIAKGRVSLPRRQPPFFNNQALGYGGDVVRGYEFFVMDGLDFGLFRSSLHLEVFNRFISFGKLMPIKSFKGMPAKVYLALNNDLGYANDPYYAAENPLSNRLLHGYGVGLDLVLYYNMVAKFEWSWKGTGGSGFYLNFNSRI